MVNYKNSAINVLKELSKEYPNQLLSTHISLALADYSNFDGISDKELYHAFNKYKCEKELDIEVAHDAPEDIIRDFESYEIDEEDEY